MIWLTQEQPGLSTPREAVPEAVEPSPAPIHRPAAETMPTTPLEAWMAAARLAPLLGLTAAREDDRSLRQAEVLDRSLHYSMSRVTSGLSPMALAETYFDWLVQLSLSPGKQFQLWQKGLRKSTRLANHLAHCMAQFGHSAEPLICPLPQDKRFSAPDWHQWPFNVIHQSFSCSSSGGTMQRHPWRIATLPSRHWQLHSQKTLS